MPNPPRPTPAKLRALDKKLQRVVDDINLLTRGNTMSADSYKLSELRSTRNAIQESQRTIKLLIKP